MKFDMNIFLPIAALALVQVSAEDSEETRKLQYSGYGPSGYGSPGRAKGRGKPKKAKKRSPPPKRTVEHKCESPEPSACAAKFCDVKFAIANGHYRKLEGENESDRNLDETQAQGYYPGYGGGHGGYGYQPFTRDSCKWTPSKAGTDYECPVLTGDELLACECFWKFEAQCESNVCDPEPKSCAGQIADGERELDLALAVRFSIGAGDLCGSHYYRNLEKDVGTAGYYPSGGHGYGGYCPFDECFSDDIYNCLCAGELSQNLPGCDPLPLLPV